MSDRKPGTSAARPYSKPGLAKPSGEISTSLSRARDAPRQISRQCGRRSSALRVASIHGHPSRLASMISRLRASVYRPGRVRTAQARPGQVEPDHAVVAFEGFGPGLEGVEARPGAVEHHDGRCVARPGVAHMHKHASDLEQVLRRAEIAPRGPPGFCQASKATPTRRRGQRQQPGVRRTTPTSFRPAALPTPRLFDPKAARCASPGRHLGDGLTCNSEGPPPAHGAKIGWVSAPRR